MKRVAVALAVAVFLAAAAGGQESRIRSTRVSAPDVVKTAQFYQTVFGLREVRRVERNGAPFEVIMNYGADKAAAEANRAPKLVVILRDPAAPPPSVSNLVFGVKNVENIVTAATKAGGVNSRPVTVSKTSGAKIAFVKDPAGNEIELIEEKFD